MIGSEFCRFVAVSEQVDKRRNYVGPILRNKTVERVGRVEEVHRNDNKIENSYLNEGRQDDELFFKNANDAPKRIHRRAKPGYALLLVVLLFFPFLMSQTEEKALKWLNANFAEHCKKKRRQVGR